MDSSNVPPPGSRPIKEPKRRLNKGSSNGSFSSHAFGAPNQPSFGAAPSSPGGSMQPFSQQPQQQQQMSFGFNPSSMTSNPSQSPSFQQHHQPNVGAFGNEQAAPAPPSFTFGTPTSSSGPQTPPTSTGFPFGNQTQSTPFSNSGFQPQQSPLGGFGTTPTSSFNFGTSSAPQQQQQPALNSSPFGIQAPASSSNQHANADSSMDSSDDLVKPSTGFAFGNTMSTPVSSTTSTTSALGTQASTSSGFGEQPKPTTPSVFSFGSSAPQTTGAFGQQSTDNQQKFGGFGEQSKAATPASTLSFGAPSATTTAAPSQGIQAQKDASQQLSSPFTFGGSTFGSGSGVSSNMGFGSTPVKEGEKKDEDKPPGASPFNFGSTGGTKNALDQPKTGSLLGPATSESSKKRKGPDSETSEPTRSRPFQFNLPSTDTVNKALIPFGKTDSEGDEDKGDGDKDKNSGDKADNNTDDKTQNDRDSSKDQGDLDASNKKETPTKTSNSEQSSTLTKTPSFSFKSTLNPPQSIDKPTFSFGSSSQASTTDTSSEKPKASPASPFSFGKQTSGFSFGASTDKSSTEASSDNSAVKAPSTFSFGAPKPSGDSSADKPTSFSFGTTSSKPSGDGSADKPAAFSFGTPAPKPSDDESASRPAFSFGTPASKPSADESTSKPAFSFGTPTSKPSDEESVSKPAFSFGTPAPKHSDEGSATKPAFSFGTPTPKSSDEGSVSKPAFSFGTPAPKPSDDGSTSKPVFSFGTPAPKPSDDKSTSKPAFSFGTSISKPSDAGSISKPAFSFGASGPKTSTDDSSEKPSSFAFIKPGATASTDNSTQKAIVSSTPSFTFGGATSSGDTQGKTPAASGFSLAKPTGQFTFGQSGSTQKKDDAGETSKDKDQVSAAKQPPSSFNFGSTTSTTTEQNKPSLFSFGTPSSNDTTSEQSSLKRKGSDLQSIQPNKMATMQSIPKLTFGTTEKDTSAERRTSTSAAIPSAQPTPSGDDSSKASTFKLPDQSKTTAASGPTKGDDNPPAVQFSLPKDQSSTKAKTPPPVVKPEDTFKPLVSKDNIPITVSSTNTPSKSILKSSSTSKDTFGVAAPSTLVQTTLQSSITSVDQIKESTRYAQLPADAQAVLLEAEQFINNQQLFSRNIQTRIDAFGGEDILHVNTQVSKLLDNVGALKEQLQAQSHMITRLGTDIKQQMDATEINKAITDRGHTRRIPGYGDHQKYFAELYEKLRNQLVEFESAIRQIEERLQQETSSDKSPQDIGILLSSQNQLFLSLSGKASELHQQVQSLLPQGNNNHIATMVSDNSINTTTRTYVLP